MSLFSRFFRQAPPPTPAPSKTVEKAPPKVSAADRAQTAADEERALQAAKDAADTPALARLVVAGSSTKVRQAAAEALEDPAVLRQLIRDVRGGNDKSVYRILTSKRDALIEQARKREQLQAAIDEAAGDLERHSRRTYDASYGPRLEEFERRWNDLAADAAPVLRDRAQHWIDRSREIIAEHLREVAAQASREQAAADAATEAQRVREEQAQASAAADAEQAQVLEEQRRALAEEQQAVQQAVRQIGELIRKARGALSDGSTSRAAGLRRTIEEKLAGAPALPAGLASQLQLLDKQLDEFRDWKSFSVTPKRAELIDDMESLVGSELDPPELAERIKGLKEEWRALGKGAGTDAEADSQRFQEAAQKAYAPCKEYFAAQALVREENLQRRAAVLSGLEAFEAATPWEQADWRAVIATLRETKQAWRNCSPVDVQAAKPQQERFAALIAALQGRVDAEHARNLKQKEALIERAQALLGHDDGRKAVDGIKDLQRNWQAVGPVPREADQRLWAEFRRHCDAVFQKREQASAAFAAGLERNKLQAIALCEQIEKIAGLDGAELLASAGALIELQKAFEALGELPRADATELRSRRDRALRRCEKSVARQHARDAERGWDDLFEAAEHVRAFRFAVASGLDAALIHSLKEVADAQMASGRRWPKRGLDTLKQALSRTPSEDVAANEAALRMLCVRAEILVDMPTPLEDQALRREYQLQRLALRMGQGVRADDANLDALAIEWVSVGPVEQAAYEPLLRRFRRCREPGNAKRPDTVDVA